MRWLYHISVQNSRKDSEAVSLLTNIPINARLAFATAIRKAKSDDRDDDINLGGYWIRIEPWSDDCLGSEPTVEAAFKAMVEHYRRTVGWIEVKTTWIDNGQTKYGSSVTLFRKTG